MEDFDLGEYRDIDFNDPAVRQALDNVRKTQQESAVNVSEIPIRFVILTPASQGTVTITNGFEEKFGVAKQRLAPGIWKVTVEGWDYIAHESHLGWESNLDLLDG